MNAGHIIADDMDQKAREWRAIGMHTSAQFIEEKAKLIRQWADTTDNNEKAMMAEIDSQRSKRREEDGKDVFVSDTEDTSSSS